MPRAHASTVLDADLDTLWSLVRDFSAHVPWIHDAVSVEMADGSQTSVGAIRTITYRDGSQLGERLVAADERAHSVSYALTVPHEPLLSLVGTIRLLPVTSTGWTYMERFVDFEVHDPNQIESFTSRATALLVRSLELVGKDPRIARS